VATIVGDVAILGRSAVKNVEIASSHDELKAFARHTKACWTAKSLDRAARWTRLLEVSLMHERETAAKACWLMKVSDDWRAAIPGPLGRGSSEETETHCQTGLSIFETQMNDNPSSCVRRSSSKHGSAAHPVISVPRPSGAQKKRRDRPGQMYRLNFDN